MSYSGGLVFFTKNLILAHRKNILDGSVFGKPVVKLLMFRVNICIA